MVNQLPGGAVPESHDHSTISTYSAFTVSSNGPGILDADHPDGLTVDLLCFFLPRKTLPIELIRPALRSMIKSLPKSECRRMSTLKSYFPVPSEKFFRFLAPGMEVFTLAHFVAPKLLLISRCFPLFHLNAHLVILVLLEDSHRECVVT